MLRLAMDVRGIRRCTGGVRGTGGRGGIGSVVARGSGREDAKFESRLRTSLCVYGGFFFKEDCRLVVETTGLVVEGPPGSLVPPRIESILCEFIKLLLCARPFGPAGGALFGAASPLAWSVTFTDGSAANLFISSRRRRSISFRISTSILHSTALLTSSNAYTRTPSLRPAIATNTPRSSITTQLLKGTRRMRAKGLIGICTC